MEARSTPEDAHGVNALYNDALSDESGVSSSTEGGTPSEAARPNQMEVKSSPRPDGLMRPPASPGRANLRGSPRDVLAKKQFDRFGFLITESNLSAAEELEDAALIRKENERLLKWQRMLSDFDKYKTRKPQKLARRTWKGIPDAVRGMVWQRLAGNVNVDIEALNRTELPEKVVNQIGLDVPRTLPTNAFFSVLDVDTGELGKNLQGHSKLTNVLRWYAALDPDVNYCQGMNFLAAVPLFYMTEHDAFKAFVFLMQELNFREYFLDGFPRLLKSIAIVDKLLQKHLPKLSKHFRKHQLPLQLFMTQWFFTMFTYNLPFPAVIRIWDWVFVEGHDVVFAVVLAVLKMVQDNMLARKDEHLIEYVMSFSGELHLKPKDLIVHALDFKGLVKGVDKLRVHNPDLAAIPGNVDLYNTQQRYHKDRPFYLRNKR